MACGPLQPLPLVACPPPTGPPNTHLQACASIRFMLPVLRANPDMKLLLTTGKFMWWLDVLFPEENLVSRTFLGACPTSLPHPAREP